MAVVSSQKLWCEDECCIRRDISCHLCLLLTFCGQEGVCVEGGGYFLNESRGLSCLRTPCLVANTNNNRTIPHHGNYVCPGWHEFTMQIWGGVILFWESISMTATNIPAPLLSTWPEHPLIIYCHILRQKFSCLLFSHLSHSHSSALFRFPTQPVFPVILFVWFSTVFLSDAVIVAPSPLSSSRNSYISIILHNPK